MIKIDGKEYRTLEEQVIWLTENMSTAKTVDTIIVDNADNITYDTTDGALVETTATITYTNGDTTDIDIEYYIPIIPGDNITIDASEGNDRIVITGEAGGGSEPSAYIKSVSISGNTITFTKKDNTTQTYTPTIPSYTAGDGIEIDGNEIAVVLNGDGGLEFVDGLLQVDTSTIQTKLTAGSGISISGNTISATGAAGHLYKHSIELIDSDQSGSVIRFEILNTTSTIYTTVSQVTAAMNGNYHAAGAYYDDTTYYPFVDVYYSANTGGLTGVYVDPTSGCQECFDIEDWTTFYDQVTTIF